MDCECGAELAERDQRNSRFKKPASTVVRRGTVVDKHLIECHEIFGGMRGLS